MNFKMPTVICEYLDTKTNRCKNLKVPKRLFFKQKCLEIEYEHGQCNLKKSLFDIIKQEQKKDRTEKRPAGCILRECQAKLYSSSCENCTIRSWPNVPPPAMPPNRISKW